MRTIIRRTKKERNRIGFQDFLDGKNEYSYFQKILQGVLKKHKRGEKHRPECARQTGSSSVHVIRGYKFVRKVK